MLGVGLTSLTKNGNNFQAKRIVRAFWIDHDLEDSCEFILGTDIHQRPRRSGTVFEASGTIGKRLRKPGDFPRESVTSFSHPYPSGKSAGRTLEAVSGRPKNFARAAESSVDMVGFRESFPATASRITDFREAAEGGAFEAATSKSPTDSLFRAAGRRFSASC